MSRECKLERNSGVFLWLTYFLTDKQSEIKNHPPLKKKREKALINFEMLKRNGAALMPSVDDSHIEEWLLIYQHVRYMLAE